MKKLKTYKVTAIKDTNARRELATAHAIIFLLASALIAMLYVFGDQIDKMFSIIAVIALFIVALFSLFLALALLKKPRPIV